MAALAARSGAAALALREWISRLPSARRREEGVRVAIVGAPNVGKSSLLNALLGYDRAIVNEVPGTTRDTIEASIWLDGTEIRLTDTAGLHAATDPVERLGVERSERAAAMADLSIVVRDCTRPDAGAAESERLRATASGPVIVAWNKRDLGPRPVAPLPTAAAAGAAAAAVAAVAEVETVALRAGGVDALVAAIRAALPRVLGENAAAELPATSLRQEALLIEAAAALERASDQLSASDPGNVAYDLSAVDLTEARRALGEMVGRGVDDAVVTAIFARFCIGK